MQIHEMPAEVTMVSEMTVKLIKWCASDDDVVQAAQVSAEGENNADTDVPRLINALMRDRHGSPFEHTYFKFFVEAPLYVFQEQLRHRIGTSINQMSGRYTVMPNRFYTMPEGRPMVNSSSQMRPEMVRGSGVQERMVETGDWEIAQAAWNEYQRRLKAGISKEVARVILPHHMMSQMYWSVNARSLMNYLSLRTHYKEATTPSYPQLEIQTIALEFEEHFRRLMPRTHQAFNANGRVAP